ncbi:hypothetical protein Slin14017_G100890 [Septoria linicola]|nr:hypothetical protein Slin14017_G100890 [Septoria linicola]
MKESDLPSSCLKVYKANINGCSPSDFASGKSCSTGCVAALQSMVEKVETACGGEELQGTGILTVFLNGNGPGAICPGAAASAGSSSSEPSTPVSTEVASRTSSSQSTSRSSSSQESSSMATSTSGTASLSGTVTASSLAPTATGGIFVDTSSAAAPTSTSTAGGAQSGSNDHSGQGSPFDTQGNLPNGAMGMASISLTTMLLTVVVVLYASL